jgi:DNA-binding MarR family transcriptional regulator
MMNRPPRDYAREISASERSEPLRRRVLASLAVGESTTRDLAAQLESPPESISRIVSALRDDGLVETATDRGDKRQRPHTLTAAGEVELSRHYAYGKPRHDLLTPSKRQRVDFLYSALDAGVQMRREANQLEDAATRISIVLREARKLGEGGLVVEAINELATTLRQIPANDLQVHTLLDELEEIGLGTRSYGLPSVVMPALAHREYSLGRLGENRDDEGPRRAGHLFGALNLYSQLAAAPRHLASTKWKERQGWTLIALARNFRSQSNFEVALEEAAQALLVFEGLEDPYGRSHCHYVFGDCLRLMGDFGGAWKWLEQARTLAEEHCFERFRAELMMQMGEVLRCRGEVGEAKGVLTEARDRAREMGLRTTRAFAHSALGAVAFHEGDLEAAWIELDRADQGFERLGHRQGIALNARRQAAVARLRFEETRRKAEETQRIITVARGHHRRLGSPAGVVACQIEEGRMRMACKSDVGGTIEEVLDLIEHRTAERNFVELDPWVPSLLDVFARETGVEHFVERSENLFNAARHRLAERARVGVQRAAELMGRPEQPSEWVAKSPGSPDEMAGETRQATGRNPEWALA